MDLIWVIALAAFVLGLTLQFIFRIISKRQVLKQANNTAEEILEAAQEFFDEQMDIAKGVASDYEQELAEKNQDFFESSEMNLSAKNEDLKVQQADFSREIDIKKQSYKNSLAIVDNYTNLVDTKQAKFKNLKSTLNKIKQEYIEALATKAEIPAETIKNDLIKKIEANTKTKVARDAEEFEAEAQINSERDAKKLINICLNRFIRPYCPERGIGFLTLPNEAAVEKMLGPNKSHIQFLEKICGIDIIYNEKAQTLSVSGFDPVRRELARASLEKLVKDKYITEDRISQTVQKTKRELFKKIKDDGNRICNELKLSNVSPEIRNMMGALRYRYSFTQNQYFHCSEVGHLCGLLASELDESITDARRSGMLHDIGKAMDHSIDGGHAVIGADFIEKNGEAPHIVHAVRAHHYDEQPNSNLAYLVIAADAISGARPGARRSTAISYMQKMDQLQEIGNSFDGVIDTYILSAGREVRILVDNQKIDDHKALTLSSSIAKKIEEDCNYPGTIKVTVVRRSQAVELAK